MYNQQSKEYHILNLGAGVQSSALLLMSETGEVRRFDYAIFADTKDEPATVYNHLEWLKTKTTIPILINTNGSLSESIINTNKVQIPAFSFASGDAREGQIRRQCTKDFKINVVEKVIKQDLCNLRPYKQIPKNYKIHQYFGISLDEVSRSVRIKHRFENDKWSTPHFPLIEKLMTRADCITWLKNYGIPHDPPRSACVYCPYKSNSEWQMLKDTDSIGWDLAVKVDLALRSKAGFQKPLFLHRSCKPIDQIFFSKEPDDLSMRGECEGMCGN